MYTLGHTSSLQLLLHNYPATLPRLSSTRHSRGRPLAREQLPQRYVVILLLIVKLDLLINTKVLQPLSLGVPPRFLALSVAIAHPPIFLRILVAAHINFAQIIAIPISKTVTVSVFCKLRFYTLDEGFAAAHGIGKLALAESTKGFLG
jgi:hypothetical protein